MAVTRGESSMAGVAGLATLIPLGGAMGSAAP
jgi:hypothetical protein